MSLDSIAVSVRVDEVPCLGELAARILVIIGGKLGPGSDLQKREHGVGEAADPGPGRGQAVTRAEQ